MIGLFFGDTDFPKLILKRLKKTKKKISYLRFIKKKYFQEGFKSIQSKHRTIRFNFKIIARKEM